MQFCLYYHNSVSAIDTWSNCNLDTYLVMACCLRTDSNSSLQYLWLSSMKITLCKYKHNINQKSGKARPGRPRKSTYNLARQKEQLLQP